MLKNENTLEVKTVDNHKNYIVRAVKRISSINLCYGYFYFNLMSKIVLAFCTQDD